MSDSREIEARSANVLLVEDEPIIRNLSSRILQLEGYGVFAAACGQEALEIFAAHGRKIGLLLTDIKMPGMSGLDLAHALRSRLPELKIILMSGHSELIMQAEGAPAGARFMDKPFSRTGLSKIVREALEAPI